MGTNGAACTMVAEDRNLSSDRHIWLSIPKSTTRLACFDQHFYSRKQRSPSMRLRLVKRQAFADSASSQTYFFMLSYRFTSSCSWFLISRSDTETTHRERLGRPASPPRREIPSLSQVHKVHRLTNKRALPDTIDIK